MTNTAATDLYVSLYILLDNDTLCWYNIKT